MEEPLGRGKEKTGEANVQVTMEDAGILTATISALTLKFTLFMTAVGDGPPQLKSG